MRRSTALASLLVLSLFITACGGAATPAPATPDSGGDTPTPAAGSGGGGGIVPIIGTTFTTGSAKVRLSGDVSLDKELQMSGGTGIGGAASLVYGGEEWALMIGLAVDEESGFALTGPITTGGSHNDGLCTFEITRNDANGLAGRIRCLNTGGIQGATVHDDVDVDIEFTAGN